MKQLLAFGALMTIAAMLGAFFTAVADLEDKALAKAVQAPIEPQDCRKWSPMDAHPNCKPELCPTPEDETQMICR